MRHWFLSLLVGTFLTAVIFPHDSAAETVTIVAEAFGSTSPTQQWGQVIQNGDFRVQPNSNEPNQWVGDGSSDGAIWTFDFGSHSK